VSEVVLLSAHDVGLVAASAYLLRQLGQPRWALVLVFPLVHSRWALVGGYVVYSTAMPLVVLGWALLVRWLRRGDVVSGTLLGACLCMTLLWHAIGFVVLGLGLGILWLLWRAPSRRARLISTVPALPALAIAAVWYAGTCASPARPSPPTWTPAIDAADRFVEYVWASVPHATAQASVLAAIVVMGLAASSRNVGAEGAGARPWRVENPFLVVSLAFLGAYFLLPRGRLARFAVVASVLALSAYGMDDVTGRFRAFHEDTKGASALMDRMGTNETLYHQTADRGVSKDFAPAHLVLRELQQYATVRHGGLPNSSFAGYGYNYVSYAGGQNPMPGLAGPPRWSPELTRFDCILVRAGQAPQDGRFRRVDAESGWELYAVCGSTRMPLCT
jgi:hypothetical protein